RVEFFLLFLQEVVGDDADAGVAPDQPEQRDRPRKVSSVGLIQAPELRGTDGQRPRAKGLSAFAEEATEPFAADHLDRALPGKDRAMELFEKLPVAAQNALEGAAAQRPMPGS